MSRAVSSGPAAPVLPSLSAPEAVLTAPTSRMSPAEQVERAGAYHFLGLHEEALECLGFLPDPIRNDRDVSVLRLSILQGQGNWAEAAVLARRILAARPPIPEFYVMGAYAIRQVDSLSAAHAFLRHGAPFSEESAIWWYNLACYECCLGNLDRVDAILQRAFLLEPVYRRIAEADDDLLAWREANPCGE